MNAQQTQVELGYVNSCIYCKYVSTTTQLGEVNWFWTKTPHGMVCSECQIHLDMCALHLDGDFDENLFEIKALDATPEEWAKMVKGSYRTAKS